ncbi:11-beta-hydroxysteroid dehydrogenase-like 4A [Impatiens glandulifera]|uniref:11-beta-hydroxysteroid dehydrogenase-like 4A n=1 Tax=Impatiens glandulifera TaxID=253017 RepID=UPI001FB0D158|nr:11-beta-hydroxysteroid dehydrogenase-like 4A [Impatiens glandulifera]
MLEMDLIHDLMDIFVPVLFFITLPILLPFLVIYKALNFISGFLLKEKLAGKVVLITGASSGIGEELAYEYARKGSCLVLVGRRENLLRKVEEKSRQLGSPNVHVVRADVSKPEDCKRSIRETVDLFGRLDHLVNNAGILYVSLFEECNNLETLTSLMDVNFWGSAYCTYFAIPHLRKTKGKIIVNASCAGWTPIPTLSTYGATKGAIISFYEALRAEIGSDIGITILTPGLVSSDMTTSEHFCANVKAMAACSPSESRERCAKAIVRRVCSGERFVIEPAWMRWFFYLNLMFPQLIEWGNQLCAALLTREPRKTNKNVVFVNSNGPLKVD